MKTHLLDTMNTVSIENFYSNSHSVCKNMLKVPSHHFKPCSRLDRHVNLGDNNILEYGSFLNPGVTGLGPSSGLEWLQNTIAAMAKINTLSLDSPSAQ